MKRSRQTKKALTSSVLALVLCFVMLLGTTFAWFTDTASTKVNDVVSGTLEIGLQRWDEEEKWTDMEDGEVLEFLDEDDNSYWEPGCTYTLPDVKIVNKGSLALKYRVKVTAAKGDNKLAEVLDVYLKDGAVEYGTDEPYGEYVGTLAQLLKKEDSIVATDKVLKAETETKALTISLHMQESAGNEYKNLAIDGITLTVEAGQATVEFDSTTNQYDAQAEYAEDLGLKWSGEAAPLTRDGNTPAGVKTLADVTDTEAKTVKIDSPELLAAFAQSVNKGNTYYGYTVRLEADLDLCNKNWTPIGNYTNYFAGQFDGKGHTISNLKCNGGAENPTDKNATCQGLFGCWKAKQQVIEFKDLKIHNADIYAKDSAGAVIGCMDNVYRDYNNSGETWIHDIEVTGKVTIEGGNAGTVCGGPSDGWNFYCAIHDVTVDVDEGSYISNLEAVKDGGGACIGGIVANASRSYGSWNLVSNIDVYGSYGIVGGVAGLAGGIWYNCSCSGDVYVENASLDDNDKYIIQHALVLGTPVPTMGKSYIQFDTLTSTGKFTYKYADGTTIYTNKQVSNNYGAWAW